MLFYRILSLICTPFYFFLAAIRLLRGKEELSCIIQRFGFAPNFNNAKSVQNDQSQRKKRIWVHCASVGEARSILPLVDYYLQHDDHIEFIISSYTKTAAQTIKGTDYAKQGRIIHAYIPYDHPIFVWLFLKKVKTNSVLWVETEFWPEALRQIKSNAIPAALVNVRLSHRSAERWMKYAPHIAKELLSAFSYIHAQTDDFARAIEAISQRKIDAIGNLKYAAQPLPYNQKILDDLKSQIHNRPTLVYASTHYGEEDIAFDIHKKLIAEYPTLLSIIIPRHPERGLTIKTAFDKRDPQDQFNTALRSQSQSAKALKDCSFYIADTLGELGLFFALQPLVIMGNSFIETPGGGHNPYEPAHFGCAIFCGPSMHNFNDILTDMKEAQAIIQATDINDLEAQVSAILADQKMQIVYQDNSLQFTKDKSGAVIDNIVRDVSQRDIIAFTPQTHESDAA